MAATGKIALVTMLPLFLMTACATGNISNRYYANSDKSATYQGLLTSRYECAIEATGRTSSSSAKVNANLGTGSSSSSDQVLPNCSLFVACLAARGWIETAGVNLDDPNREFGFHVPESLGISCY
jgi:hypothetical protein